MTKILKGRKIKETITLDSKNLVKKLKKEGIKPKIAIIRIGSDPGDISYEKGIIRHSKEIGIDLELFKLERNISEDQLLKIMDRLNNSKDIHGYMILRPLPKGINEDRVSRSIKLEKDIDAMNPLNLGKIFEGDLTGYLPCTAKAVIEILKYNDIDLEGKHITIINRNMVIGKPLAMMILEENGTVTICHSKTENLKKLTQSSDIVVTAMGRAKSLGREYFTPESIVIDVGMSNDDEGNISGDTDYEEIKDYVKAITPVIGGVGSITTSILLNQTLLNIEKRL